MVGAPDVTVCSRSYRDFFLGAKFNATHIVFMRSITNYIVYGLLLFFEWLYAAMLAPDGISGCRVPTLPS